MWSVPTVDVESTATLILSLNRRCARGMSEAGTRGDSKAASPRFREVWRCVYRELSMDTPPAAALGMGMAGRSGLQAIHVTPITKIPPS